MDTAFVRIKADGRLMAVTERIDAGPCRMLKGWVEGGRTTVVRAADCEPMPGAPMPGLHLVSEP